MKIFFDGSCGPKNPGGKACYGFAVIDEHGEERYGESGLVCEGEGATNNVAEYAALRNALLYARNQDFKVLEIFGDSKLVVNQINGMWKCTKPHLQVWIDECQELLKAFDYWTIAWVQREDNRRADELSKEPI